MEYKNLQGNQISVKKKEKKPHGISLKMSEIPFVKPSRKLGWDKGGGSNISHLRQQDATVQLNPYIT